MAMSSSKHALSVLRQIIRELQLGSYKEENVRNTAMYKFILGQYRAHQVTDKKNCKGHQEMQYVAETYLSYLKSGRQYNEVYEKYHKGERSVEEAARIVGLKLPRSYQDPKT